MKIAMIFGVFKENAFFFINALRISGIVLMYKYILGLLVGIGVGMSCLAVDSVVTLPTGINSVSLKAGKFSKLDEVFDQSGGLARLDDRNSVEFDVATLKDLEPEVENLVNVLNQFGSFDFGNNIHLGRLEVIAEPNVKYFAPIYLYGIKDNWTVGFSVPVIQFSNAITLKYWGSNVGEYRDEFSGISAELDAAFDRLNLNIDFEISETLHEKGYKPLKGRNETFIGDVQLVNQWRFFEGDILKLGVQSQLSLPTGPKADADDLTDLEVFGRSSLQNKLLSEWIISNGFSLIGTVGYAWNMADRITVRIPKNEKDSLPDEDQKEEVFRDIGDQWSFQVGGAWKVNGVWSLGAALQYDRKASDRYLGERNLRYDLLEKNTDSEAQLARLEINYSTVESYFNKQSLIPFQISYEIVNVYAGRNIQNQVLNEVWLKMFF